MRSAFSALTSEPKPAGLAAPSVATHYGARLDLSDTVVVSVSQSGSTEEIVETQAWARSCGARTVAVTNGEGSPLASGADLALVTRAGHEVAVPATKTYVAQLAAMATLASALGPRQGALEEHLPRVAGEIARLLDERRGVDELADRLTGAGTVVVSGRGLVLEAGAVVLTGSLTGHHRVTPGSVYRASFDRLGEVTATFTT